MLRRMCVGLWGVCVHLMTALLLSSRTSAHVSQSKTGSNKAREAINKVGLEERNAGKSAKKKKSEHLFF